MTSDLEYANTTGRPTSRVVRLLSSVSPGVASVQRQHLPYARAWHEANRLALARPGRRWIVLGDSMSQGIGTAAFDKGWVNQLHDRLAANGHDLTIVNLSASGARVPDVLAQQLQALRALPPAPGPDAGPDLVTVLIGSNDLLSRRFRDAFAGNVEQLVRELPQGAVVSTLPQPRAAARAANAVLKRGAADGHISLVDMRRTGPSSWRGKLAADHFHPNELGYAGLAAAFEGPIREALSTE